MGISILKKIGLQEAEINVYLTLLKKGPSLAGSIAKESKLNRTHIYDTLNKLIDKGFVSYVIKNNRKYFQATSPERIKEYIKEIEEDIDKIIPELINLEKFPKEKLNLELYEGKEGIKTILNDILKNAKEYFALGSPGKGLEILHYYIEQFHRERLKKKIKIKIIYNDDKHGRKRGREVSKLPLIEVRYMEKSHPATTYIYNDKIAIILWVKEKPFAILIDNKEITDSFREYFNLLWKSAKI